MGVSHIDDLARDLAYGARLLRRNPGFSSVVIGTLAIAIAAVVTVFSVVDAWLLRPLNFPESEQLVIAFAARPERPSEPAVWLPYRSFLGWRDSSRSFSSLTAAFPREVTFVRGADAESLLGLRVSPEFFRTFGVEPILGRALAGGDDVGPRRLVLSHALWQRTFGGSADVIGRSVALSGQTYDVVGVMPPDFDPRALDMRFEFWTPFRADDAGYGPAGTAPVALIGRLRQGASIEAARQEVTRITRDIEAGYPVNFNRFVVNLTPLQADNARAVRTTLLTIAAAIAALLLIAATNVGALMLGQGLGRIREAALRAAMGSGRARLLRQFLIESALISSLGGIGGIALAAIAIRLFAAWNPLAALPANAIRLDLRALAIAAATMTITTIVCGLGPALRLSDVRPNEALLRGGERGPSAAPAHRAQALMLVAQMAASVVMLVAMTLLMQTVVRLQTEPLGFDPRHLSVANVVLPTDPFDSPEKRRAFYREVAERLRPLAGARSVAAGTSAPLNSGAPVTVHLGAENVADAPRISAQEVTPEFFETLRITTLAGRTFDSRDSAGGASVTVINARAARDLFGTPAAAIGRHVRFDAEPPREIVGVVDDVHSTFFNTLEWKTDPIVYRPAEQGLTAFSNPTATSFYLKLHLRSDRPLAMDDVRKAVSVVSSRAAVTDVRTADDLVAAATRQPTLRMRLVLCFAVASLVLAGIGVYGLVSQTVTQRAREIAVRVALGVAPVELVAAIVGRALATAVAGVLVGGVLALALGSTLEALLYGVKPRDPASFAGAALALLAVTAVAAAIPARRATRTDPATLLRG